MMVSMPTSKGSKRATGLLVRISERAFRELEPLLKQETESPPISIDSRSLMGRKLTLLEIIQYGLRPVGAESEVYQRNSSFLVCPICSKAACLRHLHSKATTCGSPPPVWAKKQQKKKRGGQKQQSGGK